MDLLSNPTILAALERAWRDSKPADTADRHEEGGYIVVSSGGPHRVERWSAGERGQMAPPLLDPDNGYNGGVVVATFHTHSNPPVDELGREWDQAPGQSDVRWHRRRNLRGIVVGWEYIYEILSNGNVQVVGKREEVLKP